MEMVCIVCPKGCRMQVEKGTVSGNTCTKGEEFAFSELTCPMRTVCSTVATVFADMPVLPIRTDGEIPKEKIVELMKLITNIRVDKKIKRGDIVVANVLGLTTNIIATASIY